MLSEVAGQDITYFGKENIIGNPNDSFHHPTSLIQRKNTYQSQIQLNSLMGMFKNNRKIFEKKCISLVTEKNILRRGNPELKAELQVWNRYK